MSRTGKCLSLSIGNPSRWHNRFHGTIDSTTLWPFFITWVFLRGVFFKTPRKNTPDFKVYGLLFSHFITWVKKVRGVFKLLARNLNFEYLLVYYHVIQLPPEATIYCLTFLLLTFADFSIDSIQLNDVQFWDRYQVGLRESFRSKHHGFLTPWCFENTTDHIFQRYKVSFFGIRGVFFFQNTTDTEKHPRYKKRPNCHFLIQISHFQWNRLCRGIKCTIY